MVFDIIVTARIYQDGLKLAEDKGYKVWMPGQRVASREEVCQTLAQGARALVVAGYLRVDRELVDCARNLKVIVAHSSGVDHIDVGYAESKGICVANTPDMIAWSVAEHAVGSLIAFSRRIVEAHNYVKEGKWHGRPTPRELISTSLYGKTIGIIGMGRIGARIALILRPLVDRILYWSRRRKPELEPSLRLEYRHNLEELLSESDVVFIAVSLTPETRGLIGKEELDFMKPNSILVNISRGQVIDEDALVEALRVKKIAGAVLDVFHEEPLPQNHPLLALDNVLLTPHIAGYTWESMRYTSMKAVEQAITYLEEGWVENPVAGPCKVRG